MLYIGMYCCTLHPESTMYSIQRSFSRQLSGFNILYFTIRNIFGEFDRLIEVVDFSPSYFVLLYNLIPDSSARVMSDRTINTPWHVLHNKR
jgi:hypothetical protein